MADVCLPTSRAWKADVAIPIAARLAAPHEHEERFVWSQSGRRHAPVQRTARAADYPQQCEMRP